jgi:hypothetical protein
MPVKPAGVTMKVVEAADALYRRIEGFDRVHSPLVPEHIRDEIRTMERQAKEILGDILIEYKNATGHEYP